MNAVVLVPVGSSIEPRTELGLAELERRGYIVRRVWGHSDISMGRSILASQALADGFEEMIWIDSDIGFNPNDVEAFRESKLPVVSGVYPKKNGQEFACHFLPGTGQVAFGAVGGLHEVLYNGMGFFYTRREVYEQICFQLALPECNSHFGRPFFPFFHSLIVQHESGANWFLAEDYSFCHRLRSCGYQIMADTGIKLRHIGKCEYTWDDIRRHQETSSRRSA